MSERLYGYTDEELQQMLPLFIYNPVNWKDIIPEFPNTWKEEDIGNGALAHKRYTGRLFQEGTPRNAENLGAMDLSNYLLWMLVRDFETRLGSAELEIKNLHNAMFNNETSNTFRADFVTIGKEHGITIVGGWYDEVRKEVVW